MNATYSAKRIAAMLCENVRALDAGLISFDQFSVVNRATWELADRGELCVIGTPASRMVSAVHRALKEAA